MARERFTAEQIFINLREGQAGSDGVADRIVVPQKPGTTSLVKNSPPRVQPDHSAEAVALESCEKSRRLRKRAPCSSQ